MRVAPDELTFTDPAAWRDIYAHRTAKGGGGPGTMSLPPKNARFYNASDRIPKNILNASDETHALWRRTMAPSFSEGRMREQEPLSMQASRPSAASWGKSRRTKTRVLCRFSSFSPSLSVQGSN